MDFKKGKTISRKKESWLENRYREMNGSANFAKSDCLVHILSE